MPNFTVPLYRAVITNDTYELEVEADSLEEALDKAHAEAQAFNLRCPDDYRSGDEIVEVGGWQVDEEGADES